MERSIKILLNPDELALAAAFKITSQIREAEYSGIPVKIALSGGNTPKLLFSVLAAKNASSVNWSMAHFFWVDERCVPPGDPDSNYGEAHRALFNSIRIPDENIHRMKGEEEPEKEAERYSEELKNSLDSANNLPSFDHIFLGMGDDGHTASIFPGNNLMFESDKICDVAVNPYTGQKRLTITGSIINNAREVTFLITGENKSMIVNRILNSDPEAFKYPAALVMPMNGKLNWMIDSAAALHYKKQSGIKT